MITLHAQMKDGNRLIFAGAVGKGRVRIQNRENTITSVQPNCTNGNVMTTQAKTVERSRLKSHPCVILIWWLVGRKQTDDNRTTIGNDVNCTLQHQD